MNLVKRLTSNGHNNSLEELLQAQATSTLEFIGKDDDTKNGVIYCTYLSKLKKYRVLISGGKTPFSPKMVGTKEEVYDLLSNYLQENAVLTGGSSEGSSSSIIGKKKGLKSPSEVGTRYSEIEVNEPRSTISQQNRKTEGDVYNEKQIRKIKKKITSLQNQYEQEVTFWGSTVIQSTPFAVGLGGAIGASFFTTGITSLGLYVGSFLIILFWSEYVGNKILKARVKQARLKPLLDKYTDT